MYFYIPYSNNCYYEYQSIDYLSIAYAHAMGWARAHAPLPPRGPGRGGPPAPPWATAAAPWGPGGGGGGGRGRREAVK